MEFDLVVGEDGKRKAFHVTGPNGAPPQVGVRPAGCVGGRRNRASRRWQGVRQAAGWRERPAAGLRGREPAQLDTVLRHTAGGAPGGPGAAAQLCRALLPGSCWAAAAAKRQWAGRRRGGEAPVHPLQPGRGRAASGAKRDLSQRPTLSIPPCAAISLQGSLAYRGGYSGRGGRGGDAGFPPTAGYPAMAPGSYAGGYPAVQHAAGGPGGGRGRGGMAAGGAGGGGAGGGYWSPADPAAAAWGFYPMTAAQGYYHPMYARRGGFFPGGRNWVGARPPPPGQPGISSGLQVCRGAGACVWQGASRCGVRGLLTAP